MIEYGQGIAEDEVYVSFDVAVLKVLPRWNAGSIFRLAGTACSVKRILRAKKAHIAEDRAVTVY